MKYNVKSESIFSLQHYACRRNHPERPGLPTIEEDAKSFLPKLTKLASQGLKVSGGMQIVFTDDELKTVGLPGNSVRNTLNVDIPALIYGSHKHISPRNSVFSCKFVIFITV